MILKQNLVDETHRHTLFVSCVLWCLPKSGLISLSVAVFFFRHETLLVIEKTVLLTRKYVCISVRRLTNQNLGYMV